MKITLLLFVITSIQQCKTELIDSVSSVILDCPNDFEILTDPSQPLGYATWTEPKPADTTGRIHRIFRSYRPNSLLPVGENEVIYVFADENDSRATCSFTVTVKAVDTTPPVIYNCPDNVSATVEVGSEHAVFDWTEPTVTDDSGVALLKARSHWPGQLFEVSSTPHLVHYTYTDPYMNEAHCTFHVIIKTEDTTSPRIISCPNVVTREVELHSNGSYVEWTHPSVSDNSGRVNLISATHSRGEFFPTGITRVEYIFGDESGNVASCKIDVVVTEVDRMVPKISNCPNDIIAGVKSPYTTTRVNWTEPTASDNSGKALMTGRSNTPGSEFELGSSTEVFYQFSDQSGNTAYCSFDVMVINDTTKPTIVGCPRRIMRQVNKSEKGMRVMWEEPMAYDDTAYVEKMFNTHSSGDFFYIGSTGVEYVFKDLAGNTEECSFEVQITFVAEAVAGGSDMGQSQNPQLIGRIVMITIAGTTVLFVSLVVLIGVYRRKKFATLRPELPTGTGYDLPPRGPSYIAFRPNDYKTLQNGTEYLSQHGFATAQQGRLPVDNIFRDQFRSIADPVSDGIWLDKMKYRSKGAVNRIKSRKHQQINETTGYIFMRTSNHSVSPASREACLDGDHFMTSQYLDMEAAEDSDDNSIDYDGVDTSQPPDGTLLIN